jgi:hypothetical protein
MGIVINWSEEILRSVGIYRQYRAADLIRDSDRGVGLKPLSGTIIAEGTPSIVLGNSDAANQFSATVTYYEPTPYSPYVQKADDPGDIAPADQEPPPDEGDAEPRLNPTKPSTSNPKTSTTSGSTHTPIKKIPLPY